MAELAKERQKLFEAKLRERPYRKRLVLAPVENDLELPGWVESVATRPPVNLDNVQILNTKGDTWHSGGK